MCALQTPWEWGTKANYVLVQIYFAGRRKIFRIEAGMFRNRMCLKVVDTVPHVGDIHRFHRHNDRGEWLCSTCGNKSSAGGTSVMLPDQARSDESV